LIFSVLKKGAKFDMELTTGQSIPNR